MRHRHSANPHVKHDGVRVKTTHSVVATHAPSCIRVSVHVVLVEDNRLLAQTIADGLCEEGHTVDVVHTAADAIDRGRRRDMDLMILDLGLPDREGLDVLVDLRADHLHMPILVVTARASIDSRVAALDRGADGYLVKPFGFAELVARIEALVRRATGPRAIAAGDVPFTIRDDLVIEIDGLTATLSRREHAFLLCLVHRRGTVVSRDEILREVFDCAHDPGTNIIDVHVMHIRKKLAGFPILIETVRGAGLRLTFT